MDKRKAFSVIWLAFFLLGCSVPERPASVPASAAKIAEVSAPRGMVASAHPLASSAGLEVLKEGGNAVDAAVAAAFAVGVVEPNASGLGGEGIAVIFLAKPGTTVAVDYRSTAPAAASFSEKAPSSGYAAAAVPGTAAGLCLALEKYGTRPLSRVLAPAIKLADEGFLISPTLATIIADNYEAISKDEALTAILCPEGLPLSAGERLRQPELAESLRKIASGGRDAFYWGELAGRIAAGMEEGGGAVTAKDLAGYRAVERPPVRGSYRGYDLVSAPPPVGGLAVIEIMHILEPFDVARHAPLSPARVHLFAEAMRRGVADWSAYVADPDYVAVPVAGLLSKAYARSRAAEIDLVRVSEKVEAGDPSKEESPTTTFLAAADEDGKLVALTQTVSDFFGAKVAVPGTGIILNNELRNFSARGVNTLAAGKRMRTTISPTVVLRKGRGFAALGTPGAGRILTTTPLLLSNLIDYGMGIQEAIELARFYPAEKVLSYENRFPPATVAALAKLGYDLKPREAFDLYFGGAQGILVDPKTGRKNGGADPRRDGAVVGY